LLYCIDISGECPFVFVKIDAPQKWPVSISKYSCTHSCYLSPFLLLFLTKITKQKNYNEKKSYSTNIDIGKSSNSNSNSNTVLAKPGQKTITSIQKHHNNEIKNLIITLYTSLQPIKRNEKGEKEKNMNESEKIKDTNTTIEKPKSGTRTDVLT
jgi:hypothetical protein